jgi:hypothetical protein
MAGRAETLDWQAVPVAAWDALAQAAGTANPFYAPAAVAVCVDLPEAAQPRARRAAVARG